MNDTCTAHRSRVPRRSFGRVKWGVTTVEDERGPGLDFSLCFVCGSRPWGAAAFLLCLFIWLLNVFKCSPVPASFFPYISTALHYIYFFCHIQNYTEYNQQWNVLSAFNPSKCTHTCRSAQPTLRRPGSSWGFGASLKGLTSVVPAGAEVWVHFSIWKH